MSDDPAVAAAVAAGRVPPEVTTAWLNETRDRPAIAAVIFVLVLTFLAVSCRIISRKFVLKRLGYDDGLAILSLILLVPFVVLCVWLINMGSGRHYEYIQYVMPLETVELSEVVDFAAHIIYTTTLLVCRLSGLAFYQRICSLHAEFLLAVRILAGVLVAGFLPQIFLLIFHCRPVTALWPYDWQPHADEFTCLQWGVVYSVNSGVSLFCDLLLFGIPIAMIYILDLPPKRRVQLACILLPGMLVVGISVARLVLVIRGQWDPDESWSYNPMLAVETSEIGATLIALSVPGIKPMFDKCILRKNPRSATGGSSGTRSHGSRGTALRNLSLRPTHSILTSSDYTIKGPSDDSEQGRVKDSYSMASTDGIFVRVDFNVKENREQDEARFDWKNQYGKPQLS
ncbi:integral membrane pth11 [Diplogelasinospora grovesii]|uniref:Integral membrane pth11 n=1 Tax=Diplogelasinospora grovesii TaxID=303347 RepID=A0AAN6MWG4_9PEZI|nr:integral membrane pth11 [Diplogelasinospora grovesii]